MEQSEKNYIARLASAERELTTLRAQARTAEREVVGRQAEAAQRLEAAERELAEAKEQAAKESAGAQKAAEAVAAVSLCSGPCMPGVGCNQLNQSWLCICNKRNQN
jgi:multidrug efflux pump subunit AcrA (membrane-fusion protein)